MRVLVAIMLAAILVIAFTGCAEQKSDQSRPVEVENPTEKAPRPQIITPPAAKPAAPPELPKVKSTTADGWKVLESGLKYKDIKVGTGKTAYVGSEASVLYKGWLDDGKVFDASSRHGNEPFVFTVGSGGVIRGWDEGVQGMKVGGKRELHIPSEMGYGESGQGEIPPNATLHFTVELKKVEGP